MGPSGRTPALQFGHGYSAVESLTGAIGLILQPTASIRPRLFSRGIWLCDGARRARNHRFNSATAIQPWNRCSIKVPSTNGMAASIRPRLFSRGIFLKSRSLIDCCGASIRPRLFSRGIEENTYVKLQGLQLQFGHGYSAVESSSLLWLFFWSNWLQFGHGYSAVESRSCGWLLPPGNCFNSATAIQPWNQVNLARPSVANDSFNSATAIQPWNRH